MMVCRMIWYCYFFPVWFNFTVQDYLCHNIDKSILWHCALVSCTPSQSIGLVLGCALFWGWVSLCARFTISLIEVYFIMIFIMKTVTIIGIFMAILFIWNYTFWLSVTERFCTAPWIFSLDWTYYLRTPVCHVYIHCLDILQAMQLIVLVAFGAVDLPLASCMLVHF